MVVGTGSNRTIMQACMTDNDVVVPDRNRYKTINRPDPPGPNRYIEPSRNRYGIISQSTRRKCSLKPAEKNQRQPTDQKLKPTETVFTA